MPSRRDPKIISRTVSRSSSMKSSASTGSPDHQQSRVVRVPTKCVYNTRHLVDALEVALGGSDKFHIVVQHNAYNIRSSEPQIDMDKILDIAIRAGR